jgi:hypothetical protein
VIRHAEGDEIWPYANIRTITASAGIAFEATNGRAKGELLQTSNAEPEKRALPRRDADFQGFP